MGAQWWSWVLTLIGLTGWWLTGRRLWQGWAVSLAVQALWLAYALVTGQYGFIVASIAYGAMATLNLRRPAPRPRATTRSRTSGTAPTSTSGRTRRAADVLRTPPGPHRSGRPAEDAKQATHDKRRRDGEDLLALLAVASQAPGRDALRPVLRLPPVPLTTT